MVKAPGCGSGIRGFNSRHLPVFYNRLFRTNAQLAFQPPRCFLVSKSLKKLRYLKITVLAKLILLRVKFPKAVRLFYIYYLHNKTGHVDCIITDFVVLPKTSSSNLCGPNAPRAISPAFNFKASSLIAYEG